MSALPIDEGYLKMNEVEVVNMLGLSLSLSYTGDFYKWPLKREEIYVWDF